MRYSFRLIYLAGISILLVGCNHTTSTTTLAPLEVIEINESTTSDNSLADTDENTPVFRPDRHVVKAGETLNEIALQYGLDYRDLALWNNISNPNLIEVGDNLQLVPPEIVPEITTVQPVPKQVAVSGTNENEIQSKSSDQQTSGVTRAQVGIGGNRNPSHIETRNPQAVKIPYSDSEFERLQKLAGGIEQAVLVINNSANLTGPPRNTNEKNGIVWSWPVNGQLTKNYSETNKGIDIGGAKGLPIYASADGRVIYAGSGLKGYGQLVIIKHENEYLSTYAHNDRIFVAEGETIKRNQKIAEMGDTGTDRVGLHFSIRRGSESYDPKQFLPRNP